MKSIVLLSAGLDSTVAMAKVATFSNIELCITFDYGQRAKEKEIFFAKAIADHYDLKHLVIELPFLKKVTNTALVNHDQEVPEIKQELLDDKITVETANKVWVPNRNGLFINIAGAYGEALGCSYIVTGFNKEEAVTFPDNSQEFIHKTNEALSYSTLNKINLISPTISLNKKDIVALGLELNIPWHYIWSCYHGGKKMCGKCESCQRLIRAIKTNDVNISNLLNFAEEEKPC